MSDDSHPDAPLDDRDDGRLDRREFLTFMGATLAASACGDIPKSTARETIFPDIDPASGVGDQPAPRAPGLPENPFTLGVGSGDPLPDGFILWTRLAPEPLTDGGMPDMDVPVTWELARDEAFEDIVASGWLEATPQLGHSVHVDLRGLPPDTWFYYRFRVGEQWTSPTGRTRTFPAPDASPESFRIVSASCQNYPAGYYTAHHHISQEDIDAVAFLGDYIYEGGSRGPVRSHNSGRIRSLEDFRRRYALYKSDPNLQAAHQRAPWLLTWDDHEVDNNYSGLTAGHADGPTESFRRLRARAYQAYYENMPIRVPFPPEQPEDLKIHRSFDFGDLVSLKVLDGRQYRSDQACDEEGGEFGVRCPELEDPSRTMLGSEQKKWLVDELTDTQTTWTALAQQTVFAPLMIGDLVLNPDQWDGYQAERQHLIDVIDRNDVENLTILTGDIHSAFFNGIHKDPADATSELVAREIVATSISSSNDRLSRTDGISETVRRVLDHVHHFNSADRGYCLLEYTPESCRVQYKTVSTVKEQEAEVTVDAEYLIEAGSLDFETIKASDSS